MRQSRNIAHYQSRLQEHEPEGKMDKVYRAPLFDNWCFIEMNEETDDRYGVGYEQYV